MGPEGSAGEACGAKEALKSGSNARSASNFCSDFSSKVESRPVTRDVTTSGRAGAPRAMVSTPSGRGREGRRRRKRTASGTGTSRSGHGELGRVASPEAVVPAKVVLVRDSPNSAASAGSAQCTEASPRLEAVLLILAHILLRAIKGGGMGEYPWENARTPPATCDTPDRRWGRTLPQVKQLLFPSAATRDEQLGLSQIEKACGEKTNLNRRKE
ncbi:hypothetical protein E2C01_060463 [Portunus trituberculatus]|uniref:Uncharacterized protein n=1 Tax=Portunus trituberculatus TaxID=210409 RepID=A0A5B7H8S8_PORTR|nr:hypothetical protein [Portunus trituberculatus]